MGSPQSCLGEHWQEAGLNQIGFVRNQFYWIAAFSFIFTYLAGTAVYSVVVSSINAEVTRSVDQSLFVLLSFSRIMHWIPSQELHSSVSRSVRKGAALTGKGVLVPLSRGASTASWLSKAFQSGFPKQLERNLLLYRALILAQSVVSGGFVGPIQIHQIQGTRAFFWFTTEGRLSAKSMVRFQLYIIIIDPCLQPTRLHRSFSILGAPNPVILL